MAKVLTVGLHVADVLGRYVSAIPEGQGIALLDEIRLTVAGTAAATAVNLAKLGVSVDTVGVVGDDALGEFMSRTMTSAGVGCDRLRVSPTHPTSATMLPIRPDGSRPALHVIGSNAALTADDVPDEALDGVEVLHLGGSCLLPGIDGAPSADLLRRAKERGITVTMDFIPTGAASDPDALLPCFPYVDYVLPSLEDALSFAGASTRQEAIDFYLDAGVSTVIITMGGEGVSISTRESIDERLQAYEVDVVDTTGCGDAFSAGLIAGLVEGASVTEAAELGIACGSLVATGLGSDAGIVDRTSLSEFREATPLAVSGVTLPPAAVPSPVWG
ncbi:carbohydrate kinase family protein [Naasia sp. SYSU D00948]|uniref:carbohydrate kinase family protein n=1 Tax=Naasia sp. SYSU D00948 TaxID=2817379 RepID=UPI001B30591D|nr:sugar kinase [Naasia sp. SYSU D00948]